MSNLLFRLKKYFAYYLEKKGPHKIHSPFVFELSTKVIRDTKQYAAYDKILKARRMMLGNRNVIETVDFGSGAGNKSFATYRARVGKLAKARTGSIKHYLLLYRLVAYLKPRTILEFGTSTGLSTVSMALANEDAHIITMEGCASIANVATSVFERFNLKNIETSIGNFNNILAENLAGINQLDCVFFDGNHRKEPTLDYFNHCLTKASAQSFFIFDDIHWSEEMEEAWDIIKNHKEVSVSVDLYQFGIVFFRTGIEKQHFVLSM